MSDFGLVPRPATYTLLFSACAAPPARANENGARDGGRRRASCEMLIESMRRHAVDLGPVHYNAIIKVYATWVYSIDYDFLSCSHADWPNALRHLRASIDVGCAPDVRTVQSLLSGCVADEANGFGRAIVVRLAVLVDLNCFRFTNGRNRITCAPIAHSSARCFVSCARRRPATLARSSRSPNNWPSAEKERRSKPRRRRKCSSCTCRRPNGR